MESIHRDSNSSQFGSTRATVVAVLAGSVTYSFPDISDSVLDLVVLDDESHIYHKCTVWKKNANINGRQQIVKTQYKSEIRVYLGYLQVHGFCYCI